ncbi:hypothetical protein, partial [Desulfovibrio piger]|uniref:hypothetical protein n=1 Tax=Desulfovibrio piger TaxID=901 RepID=UPI0026F2DCDD
LVEGFSELAHSLLLLPRQFYGATLPCFGLYPLEKTGIARCMPDILLRKDAATSSLLNPFAVLMQNHLPTRSWKKLVFLPKKFLL